MLALIGPYWLAKGDDGARRIDEPDDWVRLEIEMGLGHPDVSVVPVLLDGAKMPEEEQLPESIRALARRNAIELAVDGSTEEIDALVDSIEKGRMRDLFAARRPATEAG